MENLLPSFTDFVESCGGSFLRTLEKLNGFCAEQDYDLACCDLNSVDRRQWKRSGILWLLHIRRLSNGVLENPHHKQLLHIATIFKGKVSVLDQEEAVIEVVDRSGTPAKKSATFRTTSASSAIRKQRKQRIKML